MTKNKTKKCKYKKKEKQKGGVIFQPRTKQELQNEIRKYIHSGRDYGDINTWDVSLITDMSYLFKNLHEFNSNIEGWNVSNVTNMYSMFYNASSFNQPLNQWNVSNVTNIVGLFFNAQSFNQPLDQWNVSNVTNMKYLFYNAINFNQPLDQWNVSNVTNMEYMFYNVLSFNQPLDQWNVSNVTNMEGMFSHATSFNQPLNHWNVANVTNMEGIFYYARRFNQPLDQWNVSNVTNMKKMFYYARSFNQPLDQWNVSNVTNMDKIFEFSGIEINNTFPLWYNINIPLQNSILSLSNVPIQNSIFSLNTNYSILQPSLQNTKTPIEESIIQIQPTDAIMDYISGEEILVTNLLSEPSNILFYYQGIPSFFITRTQLLSNLESYIRFGCLNVSQYLLPNVDNLENTAYVSLRLIGFPLATGIIPLFQLNNALYPNTPQSVCLEIIETDKHFPSVTSLQMLTSDPNAVSATHCQEGQEQQVYILKQISTSTNPIARETQRQTAGKRTRKTKKKMHIKRYMKKSHKKRIKYNSLFVYNR